MEGQAWHSYLHTSLLDNCEKQRNSRGTEMNTPTIGRISHYLGSPIRQTSKRSNGVRALARMQDCNATGALARAAPVAPFAGNIERPMAKM